MNKSLIIASLLLIPTLSSAQVLPTATDKNLFPPVTWETKTQNDVVAIQNGAGLPIVILITVNQGTGGVNIKNCGNTTHIDAGSSAVCTTNDPTNFVSISNDSSTKTSTGTYQIKQQ